MWGVTCNPAMRYVVTWRLATWEISQFSNVTRLRGQRSSDEAATSRAIKIWVWGNSKVGYVLVPTDFHREMFCLLQGSFGPFELKVEQDSPK